MTSTDGCRCDTCQAAVRVHGYEVLGRVVGVLCSTPGPLTDCLGFRLWPLLVGGGYVLSWKGVAPTAQEVAGYLIDVAADDDMTLDLRPGDVRYVANFSGATVDVLGVEFQLQPEPMVGPDTFERMGEYWRTGRFLVSPR